MEKSGHTRDYHAIVTCLPHSLTDMVTFFPAHGQHPTEEKESGEAENNDDEEEKEQKETETASEIEKEQGTPIVNEVEEMDAAGD